MVDRDAAVQDLLDKQAIREATMRYCRGADRLDAELLCSAYHPDALDEHPGSTYTGTDIGPRLTAELRERFRLTSHSTTTQTIEVHGDVAAAESYSTGRHVLLDGRRVHSLVRYVDRFEKRGDEWRIAHRLAIVELTDVLPAPDTELGGFGLARRDRTDPSYDFFDHPRRGS
jgi:ketosteroid isomerase-like protein